MRFLTERTQRGRRKWCEQEEQDVTCGVPPDLHAKWEKRPYRVTYRQISSARDPAERKEDDGPEDDLKPKAPRPAGRFFQAERIIRAEIPSGDEEKANYANLAAAIRQGLQENLVDREWHRGHGIKVVPNNMSRANHQSGKYA